MSSEHIPAVLRRRVRARAGSRCEYCLLPADVGLFPHEVDHVAATKHRGVTDKLLQLNTGERMTERQRLLAAGRVLQPPDRH